MPPKAAAKPKQKDIVVKDPKKVDEEQVIVYGVTTCISVKRALALLKSQSIEYTFHDLKKEGLPLEQAENWIHKFGPEKMLRLSAFKKKVRTYLLFVCLTVSLCFSSLLLLTAH